MPEKQYCYTDILDSTYKELDAISSLYSKTYVIRFDLHLTEYHDYAACSDGELIRRFFKSLIRSIKSSLNYSGKVAYQWVKEIERAKKAHFHCWIAVSGHKFQRLGTVRCDLQPNGAGLVGLIQKRWEVESSGGTVWVPDGDNEKRYAGHMLSGSGSLGEKENIEGCFYHLSYMAKCRGKQYGQKGHNYGTSRLASVLMEKAGA